MRRRNTAARLAAFAVHDESGEPVCFVGLKRDIRERKRAEEHQQLLLAELSHRVKNTLATVLSIASRTSRRSASIEAFRNAFEGRLQALARAHAQLTRGDWKGASLHSLVADATGPHVGAGADGRLVISGNDVQVTPRTALMMGMLLHELATNAVKYGALSVSEGSIEVTWRIDREHLALSWRERGGPLVSTPATSGFGTSLLQRGVEFELEGEATLDYRPEGLVGLIRVPLSTVLAC